MFEIRKALIEDIPLIRELTFQIWPQTYAATLSQKQIEYMLELMYSEASLTKQMNQDGCNFILVSEKSIAVAFASFSEVESGIWKLHKIYVLPNQQGKGTGRFIVDYIIKTIKQQAAVALQLQVNRYNQAKVFYEKLGFTVIKIADFEIGNGFFMNDYVMEIKI